MARKTEKQKEPAKEIQSDDADIEVSGLEENNYETKFTRDQLLKSKRYIHKRDILDTLLEDGQMYSHNETKQLILNFMKGKVE